MRERSVHPKNGRAAGTRCWAFGAVDWIFRARTGGGPKGKMAICPALQITKLALICDLQAAPSGAETEQLASSQAGPLGLQVA